MLFFLLIIVLGILVFWFRYNVANITGSDYKRDKAYAQNSFSYYGSRPKRAMPVFLMGTLEVYAPYRTSYGTLRVGRACLLRPFYNTNMDFTKKRNQEPQNNAFHFDTPKKVLILIFCGEH